MVIQMTGTTKSRRELSALYKIIMPILKQIRVDTILFYGSLLGYHRESNFIEGDDDVDVLVSRTDFNKTVQFLRVATYTPVSRKIYNCVGITFNFWPDSRFNAWHETSLLQVYYKGVGPFDIFAYDLIGDNVVVKSCSNHAFPKSVIFPTVPITFHDFPIYVPADVEKTVILSYGKDWKSPKVKNKDYIWEKIPEVICLKDV